ncbi:pol polyprotein, partial [Pseudoloma neurophilia]
RGTQFTSDIFEKFCIERNIKHLKTSPYNPTCNGIAERINQTIRLGIATKRKEVDFHKQIEFIQNGYNNTYHTTIDKIPNEIYVLWKNRSKNYTKYEQTVKKMNQMARERSETNVIEINKKRLEHKYNIGDQVLVRNNTRMNKTDEIYSGPFVVLKIETKNQQIKIENNQKILTRNMKQVKPFYS